MAKTDIMAAFALDAEKTAKEELKEKRHAELEATHGKRFNYASTNRLMDISDAVKYNLSDESIKNLMTKSAREKFEKLSKSL